MAGPVRYFLQAELSALAALLDFVCATLREQPGDGSGSVHVHLRAKPGYQARARRFASHVARLTGRHPAHRR